MGRWLFCNTAAVRPAMPGKARGRPYVEPEGTRRIREFMDQKPDGFDSLQEVADAIANYQPHRPRPRLLDGLAKNVRLGADGTYHWHWELARRQG